MITFSDVTRTDRVTYYFFPSALTAALEHALNTAKITGWEIAGRDKASHMLPDGIEYPGGLDFYSKGRPRRMPVSVFVSHFNTDDMDRKLHEIIESPEEQTRTEEISRRILEKQEMEEAWANDPSPWGPFGSRPL